MINETTIQIMQVVLFGAAAIVLALAVVIHLIKVKVESQNFDLSASGKVTASMPRVRVAASHGQIRSFVPKIVGVNQFKKSAQIKFQQARVTSQRLLSAMRDEMAKHGITPPDENPV
jgi:hypothetical protein